jgi:hypothetical protein
MQNKSEIINVWKDGNYLGYYPSHILKALYIQGRIDGEEFCSREEGKKFILSRDRCWKYITDLDENEKEEKNQIKHWGVFVEQSYLILDREKVLDYIHRILIDSEKIKRWTPQSWISVGSAVPRVGDLVFVNDDDRLGFGVRVNNYYLTSRKDLGFVSRWRPIITEPSSFWRNWF